MVGREGVQARLEGALADARWVSVIGPPGSGKTLLVRHLAASRDATAWVNARGLPPAEVIGACVGALGVEVAPGDSAHGALRRALDGTETLLVVDGIDSGAPDLGPVFQDILETTTGARLAVTALTMAGQPAERVVRVGPLALPASHEPLRGPAVELFRQRVEAAGGFPVDLVEHEDDVRRLLTASGGLPLLIEQMAVQIALVGLPNVVPTASLSEAVHASYLLLDDDQQRCFRRMSTLSFPISTEVLAAILDVDRGRAAELAAGLARRSLVEVLPDGRIDLLSPIRRHGTFLTASTDDAEVTRRQLVAWADRVAPVEMNEGAADAPWLADLSAMRAAIAAACADPATRDHGYALANRIYSSLYTAMRAGEAVEILEGVLVSGDGPAAIGAQVARRAGIAASEVRGTYEGLWLLERAVEHARNAADPDLELARTASIRAEMHLDAGNLTEAEAEARRAIELDGEGRQIVRQATRTLTDVYVSRGDFPAAERSARVIFSVSDETDERWISLSARTLLARVALEQGRLVEGASAARTAWREARDLAEDRVALLAETLLRQLDPATPASAGRPRRAAVGGAPPRARPGRPRAAAGRRRPARRRAGRRRRGARRQLPPRPRRRRRPARAGPRPRRAGRARAGHHHLPAPPPSRRRRCHCRCGSPTPSTASPGWRASAGCARPARSPRPPAPCALPGTPCRGAQRPATGSTPAARSPTAGSSTARSPPTGCARWRGSSPGSRPSTRCPRRWRSSPRPSARSPSASATG